MKPYNENHVTTYSLRAVQELYDRLDSYIGDNELTESISSLHDMADRTENTVKELQEEIDTIKENINGVYLTVERIEESLKTLIVSLTKPVDPLSQGGTWPTVNPKKPTKK